MSWFDAVQRGHASVPSARSVASITSRSADASNGAVANAKLKARCSSCPSP